MKEYALNYDGRHRVLTARQVEQLFGVTVTDAARRLNAYGLKANASAGGWFLKGRKYVYIPGRLEIAFSSEEG